jgi:acyl dehydratase
MAAETSLADLVGAHDVALGTTSWRTVTRERVQRFADATDAHEWIHLDQERARRESPFGRPVAHGYLGLSLATPFLTEVLPSPPGTVGINYGLDRVRFPAVLPVGARVRARAVLRTARPKGGGVQTIVDLTYEIEGSDATPCVARVLSLLVPPS